MKRLSLCMLLGLCLVALHTGCASVATNRYLQATNPVRIRATESGAMIAVDLYDLGTVKTHPWATLGAAAVDAGMMIGVYALGEKNDWWGEQSRTRQAKPESLACPNPDLNIDISGDNNTIIFVGSPEGERP